MPTADPSLLQINPLFINALVGMLVCKAKESNHPALRWITDATPVIARLVNATLATITAAGMALTYNTAADGSLSITLSGITTASGFTFLYMAGQNYFAQAVAGGGYDLVKQIKEFMQNHPTLPEVD